MQRRHQHVLMGMTIAASVLVATISMVTYAGRLKSLYIVDDISVNRRASTEDSFVATTDSKPNVPTSTERSAEMLFRTHLLQCQQEGEVLLRDVAKFVPVNSTSITAAATGPISYNYLSCPVMRPRYNCHHSDPNFYPKGFQPTDWKMVLNNGDNVCDLSTFVHTMKGPRGVAKHLQQHHHRVFNVFMTGDSQLGQLWEALVCAWQSQITNLSVQIQGKAFQPRPGTEKFQFKGQLLNLINPNNSSSDNNNKTEACRSELPENMARFLDGDAEEPTTLADCDDDVAMVEFDHSLRFYYIHRPDMYIELEDVVDALGLAIHDIDQLVVNSLAESVLTELEWSSRMKEGVWESRLAWNAYGFKAVQERDIGRWFGVDNHGATTEFGNPGCMPGPIDDQVNLLLYQMRTGSTLRMNGFKV